MEYYVEYKTNDETGWKRFNDKPFDVDCCAVNVAERLCDLNQAGIASLRDVRVVRLEPTTIWEDHLGTVR